MESGKKLCSSCLSQQFKIQSLEKDLDTLTDMYTEKEQSWQDQQAIISNDLQKIEKNYQKYASSHV